MEGSMNTVRASREQTLHDIKILVAGKATRKATPSTGRHLGAKSQDVRNHFVACLFSGPITHTTFERGAV